MRVWVLGANDKNEGMGVGGLMIRMRVWVL